MLSPPTMEQLQALKLAAMAAAWTAQQQDAPTSALSFDERFGLLVDAEWLARENARLTRAPPGRQAEAQPGVPRGDRLSRPAGAGQGARPPARHRPLDRRAPAPAHHRRDRHGEDLRRLRPGAPGVPAGLPGALLAGLPALPRAGVGPGGWDLRPAPGAAGAGGRPRLGRSRPGAPPGPGTAGSPRDPGGPVRHPLDHRHQPARARVTGTRRSGIRPWRMRSATGCFTTATDLCYKDPHGERRRSSNPDSPSVAPLRSRWPIGAFTMGRSACSRWAVSASPTLRHQGEGQREALPPRLEVGLLPPPTGKEGLGPAWSR